MNTLNKKEMIETIAEMEDLNKKTTAAIFNAIIETIKDAVVEGNKVQIKGFGSFYPVTRAARTGRNPHSGETIEIPERVTVKFKPSVKFKEELN